MSNADLLIAASEQIKALDCVEGSKVWQDRRLYVTARGFQRHYRGDGNSQIYFDADKKGWFWKLGKGALSREFGANLQALVEIVDATRVY